tara:strand:+ start:14396 stop:16063 length:1668 start_codon:yes stop_codon:yes gene_type:complete
LNPKYTLGLDFGTSSARACILNIDTGEVVSSHVNDYSGGEHGIYSEPKNPLVARQSPKDYLETLEKLIKNTLKDFQNLNKNPGNIVGIGVDSTGSTPIPVDQNLNPLMFQNKFKNNLNAYAWLWKDHSAVAEAGLITEKAKLMRPEYLAKCGGSYSSEWFWSKIWHCLNIDEEVFNSAYTWIEQSDFIPAMLAGIKNIGDLKRNICAAGHKAMYSESWGGLPDKDFLNELHPKLSELRESLYDKAYSFEQVLGYLSTEWSMRTGLPEGIPISVGALDAHVGAIGAGIKPGKFVKIIGTSTCDIMVFPKSESFEDLEGVSGVVNDSVLPGYIGVEAGQAAVGDLLDWWVRKVLKREVDYHLELTKKATKIKAGDSGLLALDWNNGNRNILADQKLSGLILGQTLSTQDYEIYRALIEATAYGALKIIKLIESKGVVIDEVIATGGIGHKNKLFMQIYADVFGVPVRLVSNENAVSVGAGIMAAIAYKNITEKNIDIINLVDKLSVENKEVFLPVLSESKTYSKIFKLYEILHDSFGSINKNIEIYKIMKSLNKIRK